MAFTFRTIVLKEIYQRKGRLVSGLLAITLGIAVIVAIQSVTSVSRQVVARKLDLLGANIMVLPQGATVDDYYSADVDAPTFPEEYVERIATSMIPGVDNLSPKLSRRIEIEGYSVILTGILPANELASK
ncbi:MAG: ABC transporter permease, partial [Planctomycetota bacterium]